jgi:photosystem II stability/assembly factor-like uncharacterized protein
MKRRTVALASIALVIAACTNAAAPSTAAPTVPTPNAATTTGPTSAPSASAQATPLPSGPDIWFAGLTDPTHGWAVTAGRLLVTADGGSTWREVTPPGGFVNADAGRLLGVDFVDAAHGWMAINEAFTSGGDASYGRVDILRTTDGGRTWSSTQLPRARFAVFGEIMPAVQFDLLDATHGFAFQSGNEAKGKNDSDLFWTADGGASWSVDRPTGDGSQGNEGMIGFSTPTDGVIVGAMRGNGIAVTHDGGRTWNDATLALPSGALAAPSVFGQPDFVTGGTGLVVVDFQADSGSVFRAYRTLDAGSSWTPVAALPSGVSTVAFLDAQRWIGSDGTGMVTTHDGGVTWVRSSAVGLPGAPVLLQMADSQFGWALVAMGVCLDFKSNCSSRTGLYATVDGGSTWTQLWPG